ncbi:hypothetical protein ACHAXR_004998, partial [Thalassiosira sp. AJA248-18]
MSTAAPKNPFTTKPSSSGAAFPPMSAAAPKPFGASLKKEESKASEKVSSSSAAFPPMSKSAPSPFGGFSKTSAPPSSSPAFPPMSTAAPKNPFTTKPSSSGAAFPPMSAAAPKPFGASGISASGAKSDPRTAGTSSKLGASVAEKQNQPDLSFSVSSRYEAELWDQVNLFAKKTSNAKRLQREVNSCISSALENDIENMVNKYQEKKSNAGLLQDQNAAIQKRLLHLFSVQDDLDRQKRESNLAIEEQATQQISSNLARKEPLDAESEKMRRAIVSKCHKVQNLISTVENRMALNKDIFSCSAGNQHDTIRASDYFNQWSRTQSTGRQQTTKGATNALFKSLTSGYDRVREFDSFVKYLSDKSANLSYSQASSSRGLRQSGANRTKNKSRGIISPLPKSHLLSPLTSRRKASNVSSILERQQSLRQMAKNELSGGSSKTFCLRKGQMMARDASISKKKIPDWRSKGKNELFSNSKTNQSSLVPKSFASPAVAKTLFSSPIPGAKVRSDWNTTSERDKALLKVNIPQKLKHIESSDAAKAALAKFGTTPEKLAEGRDILSRDAEESKAPLKSSSNKKAIPSMGTTSSNATFPAQSSQNPLKLPKSNAAAFPPMPTRAPKPVSQSQNPSVSTAPTVSMPAPAPKAGDDVDYKSILTKFYQENSPGRVAEVDFTLQKYKGKEAEMFVSLAKKYNKPNALNEVFESRVKEIDKNDYLALTTLYLQVFNPARATPEKVQALWTKHKGKEESMFAQLSAKWFTCNPLEKPKTAEPAAAPAQTKPQNLFAPSSEKSSTSAPSPTPFATAPAPSPFATAPAPSPFAKEVKSNDTGAAKHDYHHLLTKFYQKHNAQKIPEVAKTLEKYKGREPEMFAKLAQKYKTSNPLDETASTPAPSSAGSSFGFGNMNASLGASKSPFGGGGGGENKSPFGSTTAPPSGASTTSSATTAPAANISAFGGGENKSPFGAAPAASATANSPFSSTSGPSPFGGTSGGSAFGGAPATATPFSS